MVRHAPGTRRAFFTKLMSRENALHDLQRELAETGRAMKADERRMPQLERWADLAALAGDAAQMGKELEAGVGAAIDPARAQKTFVCPAALRWIQVADPLAGVLGGPLADSLVRSRRWLELFLRESRDLRALQNYLSRTEQETALRELVADGPVADEAWALHYVGDGKTTLMRSIKSVLAKELKLATARIDFDLLDPDYPVRAPGLLQTALAEELRKLGNNESDSLFESFDRRIKAVHGRLEGAYQSRSMERATGTDDGFRAAFDRFVRALLAIARHPAAPRPDPRRLRDPGRVRPDGILPASVAQTFELLEEMHTAVPSVRVIFAGRRPLAGAGHGRTHPGSRLPPRP